MTNEELAEAVQRGEDRDGSLLMELWSNNQGYIHAILKRYDGLAEESDIQQEAFIGLMEAVRRWSSERGVPFMVYAGHWIRAACKRYIEKNQGISINMQTKIRQMHQFVEEYERDHGERPQNGDICAYMGISIDQLESLQNAENKAVTASLDAPCSEDEEISLADVVSGVDDPELDAVEDVQQEQLSSVIWDEVDQLPEDQAEVLHGRYESELTAREVGELTGRTGQQIADVERKALAKMRSTPRTRKRLLPFLDDEIRSGSLRGCGVSRFNSTWSSSTERVALKMYRRSE